MLPLLAQLPASVLTLVLAHLEERDVAALALSGRAGRAVARAGCWRRVVAAPLRVAGAGAGPPLATWLAAWPRVAFGVAVADAPALAALLAAPLPRPLAHAALLDAAALAGAAADGLDVAPLAAVARALTVVGAHRLRGVAALAAGGVVESLALHGGPARDAGLLAALAGLARVELVGCVLPADLAPLARARELVFCRCTFAGAGAAGAPAPGLAPLARVPSLEFDRCNGEGLARLLGSLAGAAGGRIVLGQCQLPDLAPLAGFAYVELRQCSGPCSLAPLAAVDTLVLSRCRKFDCAPLARVRHLSLLKGDYTRGQLARMLGSPHEHQVPSNSCLESLTLQNLSGLRSLPLCPPGLSRLAVTLCDSLESTHGAHTVSSPRLEVQLEQLPLLRTLEGLEGLATASISACPLLCDIAPLHGAEDVALSYLSQVSDVAPLALARRVRLNWLPRVTNLTALAAVPCVVATNCYGLLPHRAPNLATSCCGDRAYILPVEQAAAELVDEVEDASGDEDEDGGEEEEAQTAAGATRIAYDDTPRPQQYWEQPLSAVLPSYQGALVDYSTSSSDSEDGKITGTRTGM